MFFSNEVHTGHIQKYLFMVLSYEVYIYGFNQRAFTSTRSIAKGVNSLSYSLKAEKMSKRQYTP